MSEIISLRNSPKFPSWNETLPFLHKKGWHEPPPREFSERRRRRMKPQERGEQIYFQPGAEQRWSNECGEVQRNNQMCMRWLGLQKGEKIVLQSPSAGVILAVDMLSGRLLTGCTGPYWAVSGKELWPAHPKARASCRGTVTLVRQSHRSLSWLQAWKINVTLERRLR